MNVAVRGAGSSMAEQASGEALNLPWMVKLTLIVHRGGWISTVRFLRSTLRGRLVVSDPIGAFGYGALRRLGLRSSRVRKRIQRGPQSRCLPLLRRGWGGGHEGRDRTPVWSRCKRSGGEAVTWLADLRLKPHDLILLYPLRLTDNGSEHVHVGYGNFGGEGVSGMIHGRESVDGELGAETRLHISDVREVTQAPTHMGGCLVTVLSDKSKTYWLDDSRDHVADQQAAFLEKQEEDLAAKYGRRWTRF